MSVLILNRSYNPLTVVSDMHGAKLLFKDRARTIDNVFAFVHNTDLEKFNISKSVTFRMKDEQVLVFSDILIVNTNYYQYRRPPAPSKSIIWHRDNRICCYCGEVVYTPTIDHVIPQCKGGQDTYANLVTSCATCNRKKGHMDVEDFLTKYNTKMHYTPKTPSADFALFYSHKKPHWNDYLFV